MANNIQTSTPCSDDVKCLKRISQPRGKPGTPISLSNTGTQLLPPITSSDSPTTACKRRDWVVVLPCHQWDLVAGAWEWNGTPEQCTVPASLWQWPYRVLISTVENRREITEFSLCLTLDTHEQACTGPVVWRQSACISTGCCLSGV